MNTYMGPGSPSGQSVGTACGYGAGWSPAPNAMPTKTGVGTDVSVLPGANLPGDGRSAVPLPGLEGEVGQPVASHAVASGRMAPADGRLFLPTPIRDRVQQPLLDRRVDSVRTHQYGWPSGPSPVEIPGKPLGVLEQARSQEEALPENLLVCTGASGGVGLSVLAAMIALETQSRGLECALVDADFESGGLDLLLGIENEPGLRFNALEAPLGVLDGPSLTGRLPCLPEGVHVLAYDPWRPRRPDWWEVRAAIQALAPLFDLLVIDGARGRLFDLVPALVACPQLLLVELSVLGLARGRVQLERLQATGAGKDSLLVVGVGVRGASGKAAGVGLEEAEEHLGRRILGPIRLDPKVAMRIQEGLGVARLPRGSRAVVEEVVDLLEDRLAGGPSAGLTGRGRDRSEGASGVDGAGSDHGTNLGES
ncbi:hypothetical protein CRD60_07835 [Bifidobacterium aemilianum]|uniref:Uncharacterized protein n=2 Tax=Bifidobacterium aemilianum TaxID=2493120 RepID=A0A366K6E2_9BIFI|nr:hypothetical protein CRD60_07835 [Bifidobacterium aemilianum]